VGILHEALAGLAAIAVWIGGCYLRGNSAVWVLSGRKSGLNRGVVHSRVLQGRAQFKRRAGIGAAGDG
jgi:hypothetical protein